MAVCVMAERPAGAMRGKSWDGATNGVCVCVVIIVVF